jgi:hypothetical protein
VSWRSESSSSPLRRPADRFVFTSHKSGSGQSSRKLRTWPINSDGYWKWAPCPGQAFDRVRRGAGAQPDPGIVEQDDLTVASERVADLRVEALEVASEVVDEHERDSVLLPEASVGEADVSGIDELV